MGNVDTRFEVFVQFGITNLVMGFELIGGRHLSIPLVIICILGQCDWTRVLRVDDTFRQYAAPPTG